MKRIILLVMSFAVSMCLLVGCGDNKSDTYSEVTSEPVATSTTDSEQKNNVVDSNGIVENNHFNITRTEFINKYDELYDELYAESHDNPYVYNLSRPLEDYPTNTYEPIEDILLANPNAYKQYVYDTTLYSDVNMRPKSHVGIVVDKDDNVIGVTFLAYGHALQTEAACQNYLEVKCTAAYMAITGETNAETARNALYEAYSSPETGKKGNYVYGFSENENYDTTFIIKVINQ